MANNVFANGRELSCKSGSGKTPCAMPNVVWTPPQAPPTPMGIPVPYPTTGMTSDSSKGSRDVKISKKEVMLKNKSRFKKCLGDQPGKAPKKGFVTSQQGGKVYFNSWSMDVKIEGENAVRHLDITTLNHGSMPGNTPTWPFVDQSAGGFQDDDPCKGDIIKEQEACAGFKPYGESDPCGIVKYDGDKRKMTETKASTMTSDAFHGSNLAAESSDYHFKGGESADPKTSTAPTDAASAEKCLTARSCQLVPYEPDEGTAACCPSQTPHHLVEAASFFKSKRGKANGEQSKLLSVGAKSDAEYRTGEAPSICAFGPSQWRGSHGQLHTIQGNLNLMNRSASREPMKMANGPGYTNEHTIAYKDARDNGIMAAQEVNPTAQCSEDCMGAQLDAYHCEKLKIDPDDKIKCVASGRIKDTDVAGVNEAIANRSSQTI